MNFKITEKMLGLVHNIAELWRNIPSASAITAQGKSNSGRFNPPLRWKRMARRWNAIVLSEGRRALCYKEIFFEVQNAYGGVWTCLFDGPTASGGDFLEAHHLLTHDLVKHIRAVSFWWRQVLLKWASGLNVQFVPSLIKEVVFLG